MEFAILEDPDSMEKNWTYRITYNTREKVKNGTEIMVLFYGDYLKVVISVTLCRMMLNTKKYYLG